VVAARVASTAFQTRWCCHWWVAQAERECWVHTQWMVSRPSITPMASTVGRGLGYCCNLLVGSSQSSRNRRCWRWRVISYLVCIQRVPYTYSSHMVEASWCISWKSHTSRHSSRLAVNGLGLAPPPAGSLSTGGGVACAKHPGQMHGRQWLASQHQVSRVPTRWWEQTRQGPPARRGVGSNVFTRTWAAPAARGRCSGGCR
jgi:hypothetical protein